MDTQPPFEQNLEKTSPNRVNENLPGALQEQHLNLKLEVEQLYGKVDRLRGLFQTLVSGLIIAIIIAIGISGWFAYRLLVQEQVAQREAEQAAATEAEILERVEQLAEQLQRQEEQLQRLSQQIPEELKTLTDSVQANQRQLERLRDRLKIIETEPTSQTDAGLPTP
ncbi:MAG: hypothetical protein QNJ46_21750 [Leptolyngbyaceae cyanobacterium MO_188.B28]|nr:hypothetical protein [Leptolyngbyaceae cyanobacterium MO_188.B28]